VLTGIVPSTGERRSGAPLSAACSAKRRFVSGRGQEPQSERILLRLRMMHQSRSNAPQLRVGGRHSNDVARGGAERPRPGRPPAVVLRILGVLVGAACLLAVIYLLGAKLLFPSYLHGAARRAGLQLEFSSLASRYPGELRITEPRLFVPGGDAALQADSLEAELPWRSLLTSNPGVGTARADGAELEWPKGHLGPFDVRLRLRSRPSGSGGAGWLAIDGRQTTLRTPNAELGLVLRARLEVYHWSTEGGSLHVELGEGTIEASHLSLQRAPTERAAARRVEPSDLHAILRVDAGTVFEGHDFYLLGRGHVQGGDASIAFDWLGVDDAVRWMLSDLVDQPFQLEATTRICGKGLDLEDIRFSSGVTGATGALHTDGDSWRGAISLRRGSLVLGVTVLPSGANANLSPAPYWLDGELAQVGSACANTVL
jgi:hypothetical protein